jgi:hypothetical protein
MIIVHVTWTDTCTVSEWISKHEDAELESIESVGWLWYEDEHVIKIAQSVDSGGKYCDVTTIPKSIITKMIRINKSRNMKK